jgi:transcriptional regulator with XRE-family HTH domain
MRFEDTDHLDSKLLGSRIRQARELRGFSQEDFAAAVSRDQGAISEYENGKRKLSAVDLLAFAKILDMPLLYFYQGEISMEDLDRAMIDEFRRLPTPETKQAAIQIIRTFADTHN